MRPCRPSSRASCAMRSSTSAAPRSSPVAISRRATICPSERIAPALIAVPPRSMPTSSTRTSLVRLVLHAPRDAAVGLEVRLRGRLPGEVLLQAAHDDGAPVVGLLVVLARQIDALQQAVAGVVAEADARALARVLLDVDHRVVEAARAVEIGRASCRERV